MVSLQRVASSSCWLVLLGFLLLIKSQPVKALSVRSLPQHSEPHGRERISLSKGWRFWRSETNPDGLIYDQRPDLANLTDTTVLKPWILPSGNDFISDEADRHKRPGGNPGSDVKFVQKAFDDSDWEAVSLPHDWAIKGPFYTAEDPIVGGGMGRLPVYGVGWYRRKLDISHADMDKSVYLDIDGAMSYAIVWLNGNLVGGWPYGYNSFRLDLSPYIEPGKDNQFAIRLDNPVDSSRWYNGGGLYRNVWLTKVDQTHVAHWGTYITSKDVSAQSATLDLAVEVENKAEAGRKVNVVTEVHEYDSATGGIGKKVASFPRASVQVPAGQKEPVSSSVKVKNPQLWGPPPAQKPNLYVAVTRLYVDREEVDTYETRFGIRSVTYDGDKGLLVNGEHVSIYGVNQHHDLGALGAAFNVRAAERQLETLQELGCNAIRMSHNPPAPELLELTDRMGFVVMDEIFDCWEEKKTTNDFHLIFSDWHEADLRAFIRRDRNHASIVIWSFGNEVGEQYDCDAGAALAKSLHDIVFEEDPTRQSTASMNYAKPNMSFPTALDVLSLNYQGAGIRDTPAYSGLKGITTPPQYPGFHKAFPEKLLLSTETAAALSSRGTYLFPVTSYSSAPVNDTSGGNSTSEEVSAYELYSADFGASVDKTFASIDENPYVAGEFVWSGWDYLGEPTPYYTARSAYFGIIDLAGFKKDRFYLYQSRWKSDHKMAHILPHWTWPERVGKVTPVHVFTSGDEAELFVNGESQGRKTKEEYTYRLRWDDIVYQPGELHVVAYKDGKEWATDSVKTVGEAAQLRLTPDRNIINADGDDLSFITVEVIDKDGNVVPEAHNLISFSVNGPGELVATDNGDPADMNAFPSPERNAFSGLALAIVRAKQGSNGQITITASAKGLPDATVIVGLQN